MIFVLFALVMAVAYIVGCGFFLVAIMIRHRRSQALSLALGPVVFGVCCCATFCCLIVGVGATAVLLHIPAPHAYQHWLAERFATSSALLVLLIIGGLDSLATSALAMRFHQFFIERMTFALFRVYATVVVAGIGSISALFVSSLMFKDRSSLWPPRGRPDSHLHVAVNARLRVAGLEKCASIARSLPRPRHVDYESGISGMINPVSQLPAASAHGRAVPSRGKVQPSRVRAV